MSPDESRDIHRCRMGLLAVAVLHWVIAAIMFHQYLSLPPAEIGSTLAALVRILITA